MKRIFQHPTEATSGKRYWRSLNELADKPEFKEWLHREFPAGAAELEMDGLSRRNFLRLMGASMALAGLGMAGCRRPESLLVPYTKSPEWIVPGKSLQYATSMPRRRGALPLLATVVDGRPIKLDGNPHAPLSNGGTDIFAQGAILDLYDPDRAKEFKKNGETVDAKAFADELDRIAATFAANKGEGLAFLTESYTSPTISRLRGELTKKFPGLLWASYEPLGNENEIKFAEHFLGGRYQMLPQYEKADVILSLDCDFLGSEEGGLEAIRGFAAGRRRLEEKGGKMNRLYTVESRFSLTGGMADHRLRLASSEIGEFADALLQILSGQSSAPNTWIGELAKDLLVNKGRALVVVGSQQPRLVHKSVFQINQLLNSIGRTMSVIPAITDQSATIQQLALSIERGTVQTLFILGGNPVFNAPAELNWADVQKKVATVVRYSLHEDETSAITSTVTWQVPAAHFLETWGDARGRDGSYLARQPMILPLWGGLSETQILARLIGTAPTGVVVPAVPAPAAGAATPVTGPLPAFPAEGAEVVQETFKQIAKLTGDISNAWRQFVHDGFLAGSAFAGVTPKFYQGIVEWNAPARVKDGIEVTFYAANVDDGRYLNNGWLQELPEPMTKLTWDNAALISPALAKKLGLEMPGDKSGFPGVPPIDKPGTNVGVQPELGNNNGFPMIEITVNGRTLVLPALVAPGQAENSIAIAVGYGRTAVGHVGKGSGFNAYALRTAFVAGHGGAQSAVLTPDSIGFLTGVTVKKASGSYNLAITQEHNSMEGRGLAREITLEDNAKNPGWVQQIGDSSHMPGYKEGFPAIYAADQPKLDAVMQWGLVVDLNTCVGCNACMIACQAENNIPIVGKEQVINGREMHWIRNDRYFSGEPEDPQMITQPVACMHCENAPCETVCPVNATVHSEDGLNVMAYNRCIGTRYCANNCPYKVRRFNFFNYNERPLDKLYWGPLAPKGSPDTVKMQKNPNVTVRMRGVMEKCTYCVQRIEEAKINQLRAAKDSPNTTVKADAFQSACQQVCPAEAIAFGDINNPESQVSKLKANPRNYAMLDYLGVKPRTSYLGRVRNPNPAMPGAEKVGMASPIEHGGGGHGAGGHGSEHGEKH